MRSIALVSDTHIPSQADELPDFAEVEIEDADIVVHAGDFDSTDAYEAIRDLADEDFVAVSGNADPTQIGLPRVDSLWVEDVQFVVTHGNGSLDNYDERVVSAVKDARDDPDAIGMCGHTHELRDRRVDGVRLLNPGSATGADPADSASLLLVDVDGSEVSVEARWR
ncbi:metallophosphoesterase family protein [Halobacterium zhouii]|uniref:metallophosphoesterase family protein n=1 Tax=Halobacterium zhouii TaxID=2902624 RepID=UPI001E4B6C0D|nr:YfcE family phosphodiesterase [Halobacterium zhouii]